ncbi:hypothetical protein SEA_HANK144_60 [Streptomyces phage Hank144]|uniref:Uncharacterized protein n=1 Tax=Streptomyces phage Hank144 TaxID=2301573 RepID=A0A385DNW1_9CAUD|nr:hypothetical protein KGG76_gp60 [Streptomyces phage Hank144]AXQ61113.1 hypothetical protein SEA_HANK144_60 [Streptomyces phage Hank144]
MSDWIMCKCGIKRGWATKRDAERALGRARAKRNRRSDAIGTRRGQHIEHRVYQCELGYWHLTSENRKTYESKGVAA